MKRGISRGLCFISMFLTEDNHTNFRLKKVLVMCVLLASCSNSLYSKNQPLKRKMYEIRIANRDEPQPEPESLT